MILANIGTYRPFQAQPTLLGVIGNSAGKVKMFSDFAVFCLKLTADGVHDIGYKWLLAGKGLVAKSAVHFRIGSVVQTSGKNHPIEHG